METVSVAPISSEVAKDWERRAEVELVRAKEVIVESNEDYVFVGQRLINNKDLLKQLDVERKKITDPLTKAKSAVMAFFFKPQKYLEDAINYDSIALTEWDKKLRLEQKRLQEEAQKKAEDEARKLRERAEKVKSEDKKAELLQQAQMKASMVASVNIAPPKIAGLRTAEDYDVDVVDFSALLAWVMETKNEEGFVVADISALKKTGRATKGKRDIPGVKWIITEKTIGARV